VVCVEFLLADIAIVLEKSLSESVVFSLDSFVFPTAVGDVERSWAGGDRLRHFLVLVSRGAVDRGPLALRDVDELVE